MKYWCFATALFVAYLLTRGRAEAIAAFAQPQTGAPVKITTCKADIRSVNNGWGTHVLVLDTGSSFQNTSTKIAVAVLVHFQLASVFGDVVGNRFGESSGTFAPNVVIDGNKWSTTDVWPGLGIVRCSVIRVLFVDGSTWSAPGV